MVMLLLTCCALRSIASVGPSVARSVGIFNVLTMHGRFKDFVFPMSVCLSVGVFVGLCVGLKVRTEFC